jgi:hypothetical protein
MNSFIKNILTGSDNHTFAIGRVLAFILFIMAIVLIVPAELITVKYNWFTIAEWGDMLNQWRDYIPVVSLAIWGLIYGTSFTEPKTKSESETKDD